MDPNQQPNQVPQPSQPQLPPQPATPVQPPADPAVPPQPGQQPAYTPQPAQPYQPNAAQPAAPQTPTSYAAAPQAAYDPNYLDSIAPPPPPPKFFSGSFGKIFFGMLFLFVIGVSLIIAFSGKDNTADLQQIAVRLDNFSRTTKTAQKHFRSSNLQAINSKLMIWMTSAQKDAEDLLKQANVKKIQYNKQMVAKEKALATELDDKFEDARLSARLERVYSGTMAAETEKLMNLYNTMAKKSGAKAIREYAKNASANLKPLHDEFDNFVDDGN